MDPPNLRKRKQKSSSDGSSRAKAPILEESVHAHSSADTTSSLSTAIEGNMMSEDQDGSAAACVAADIKEDLSSGPKRDSRSRVVLVGHPRAGKTSLKICLLGEGLDKKLKNIEDPVLGNLSIWEFDGKLNDAHRMFFNDESIFIVVMDMTKPLHEPLTDLAQDSKDSSLQTPADYLDYWCSSLQTFEPKSMLKSTKKAKCEVKSTKKGQSDMRRIVIVLTHDDETTSDDSIGYMNSIRTHIGTKSYTKHINAVIFTVSNKFPDVGGINDIRGKITDLENVQSNILPLPWHRFRGELKKKQNEEKTPMESLEEVKLIASQSGVVYTENVLRFFHLMGDLIFFDKEGLREYIYDPQWLINRFSDIITASREPQHDGAISPKRYRSLSNGILPEDLLETVWSEPEYVRNILITLMKELALLREVTPKLMKSIDPDFARVNISHRMFLIPSLMADKYRESTDCQPGVPKSAVKLQLKQVQMLFTFKNSGQVTEWMGKYMYQDPSDCQWKAVDSERKPQCKGPELAEALRIAGEMSTSVKSCVRFCDVMCQNKSGTQLVAKLFRLTPSYIKKQKELLAQGKYENVGALLKDETGLAIFLRRLHPSTALLNALVKAKLIKTDVQNRLEGMKETWPFHFKTLDSKEETCYVSNDNSRINKAILDAICEREDGDKDYSEFCDILCRDEIAQTTLVEEVLGCKNSKKVNPKDKSPPGEPNNTSPKPDEGPYGRYPMTKNPRGRAVIINIRDSTTFWMQRCGSERDVDKLTELFQKTLGFKVDIWSNCTKGEMQTMITKVKEDMEQEECDAFVMFVMSHGGLNRVSDYTGASIDLKEDILIRFNRENAFQLENKPKLFFIDTCRGGKTSEPPEMPSKEVAQADVKIDPHVMADFLCLFATADDYKSYLMIGLGTRLMIELVDVFTKGCAEDRHVLELITEITRRVDKDVCSEWDRENQSKKQVPECRTTLKHLLYFPPVEEKQT